MKRLFIASFVAAAAVAYPAYAGAATVKGVVVGASAARGTIAVASTRGAVRTLHVAKLVRVGTRVTATAASRADGTFTASHVTARGRVHRAHIHGVVTARRNGYEPPRCIRGQTWARRCRQASQYSSPISQIIPVSAR